MFVFIIYIVVIIVTVVRKFICISCFFFGCVLSQFSVKKMNVVIVFVCQATSLPCPDRFTPESDEEESQARPVFTSCP